MSASRVTFIRMTDAPFHIYRSSAGSGKTYTLSKEYLKLALVRSGAFRQILGVTFTNKASSEMKGRIMRFLKELKEGTNPPILAQLAIELKLPEEVVRRKAEETLTDILHQYGRFSVLTIDSFFHQVIRSFAREMGLQGTFTIELDQEKVMQKVIDEMLMVIGEPDQKQLRDWLTQFAESKVEEGKSWDFRDSVKGLAREILKDHFKVHSKGVLQLSDSPSFFEDLKRDLNTMRYSFEGKVKKICEEAFQLMSTQGVDPADFKGGATRSPALLFRSITVKYEITDAKLNAVGSSDEWIKAKDPKANQLLAVYHSGLGALYDRLVATVQEGIIQYHSALEVQRFLYTFGILSVLNKYLQKYREDYDVMLIADLPDFLRQIIQESDTPYIYERVGNRFEHYLIDEFQDTSTFQWENFKPLIRNAVDQGDFSMIVGDVKQSIYRFRGGDWELLQHKVLEGIHPSQRKEIPLDINYRSTGRLVAFNNDFFTQTRKAGETYFQDLISKLNGSKTPALLFQEVEKAFSTYADVAQRLPGGQLASLADGPASPTGGDTESGVVRVEFIQADETEEDSAWTDEAIRRTIRQVEEFQRLGYELRDIAILTRYTKEGSRVANAFIEYGHSEQADPKLRYEVISNEALFLTSSHVVKFIISLIKWLNDEQNTIVQAEWVNEYSIYLSEHPLDTTTFSHLQDWKKLVPAEFLKHKDFMKTLPLFELVEGIIRIFKLERVKPEYTYLQGFQDAVLDYGKNERGDIPSFLEWWEEVRKEKSIQLSDENNAIKILTIHKAKGLEFPIVILPFLSWSLDHEFGKDNILWCKGGDAAPFDRLPLIPLKYNSTLASTYWAEDYYLEKLRVFLDNLNLLYVAFTRPVDILWVFAELPKKSDWKNVRDLVLQYAQESKNWDFVTNSLKIGAVKPAKKSKARSDEFGLEKYHSHPWRSKVSVQIRGSAELSGITFANATAQGIRLHQMLSKIKYRDDLRLFSDTEEIQLLQSLVNVPEASDWFDSKWKVDTEVPILLPGGDFKRIDRVNRSEEETLIIDFKTGKPREADELQVKEYLNLFEQMDYKGVRGFLFYLNEMRVSKI